MGLRRFALAPLYWIADWIDANPVSAVGVVIAFGALAVFVATALPATGGGELAFDTTTASVFAETARRRPAYLAAALAGLAVVLFYDG